jgi:hypothetical protein
MAGSGVAYRRLAGGGAMCLLQRGGRREWLGRRLQRSERRGFRRTTACVRPLYLACKVRGVVESAAAGNSADLCEPRASVSQKKRAPVPPPPCRPLITSAGCRPTARPTAPPRCEAPRLSSCLPAASGPTPNRPASPANYALQWGFVTANCRPHLHSTGLTLVRFPSLLPSDCGLETSAGMAPTADSDGQSTSDYMEVNCRNPNLRKFQAHRLLFGKHQTWCVRFYQLPVPEPLSFFSGSGLL